MQVFFVVSAIGKRLPPQRDGIYPLQLQMRDIARMNACEVTVAVARQPTVVAQPIAAAGAKHSGKGNAAGRCFIRSVCAGRARARFYPGEPAEIGEQVLQLFGSCRNRGHGRLRIFLERSNLIVRKQVRLALRILQHSFKAAPASGKAVQQLAIPQPHRHWRVPRGKARAWLNQGFAHLLRRQLPGNAQEIRSDRRSSAVHHVAGRAPPCPEEILLTLRWIAR